MKSSDYHLYLTQIYARPVTIKQDHLFLGITSVDSGLSEDSSSISFIGASYADANKIAIKVTFVVIFLL